MQEISRNAQVLKFLIQRKEDGIGHIRLSKMAYMADLEARKYIGHPITEFAYIYDKFGPFDAKGFYPALSELENKKLSYEEVKPLAHDKIMRLVHDVSGGAVRFELPIAERRILRWVFESYVETDTRELLEDIVYETPPMEEAIKDNPLNMDMVNNVEKSRLGVHLEDALRAEQEIAEGRYRPIEEFFDELLRTPVGREEH